MNPDYESVLDRLEFLLRKKPMTAREISEETGCCRPTAYQRLEGLKKRGVKLKTHSAGTGRTGPVSTHYRIT